MSYRPSIFFFITAIFCLSAFQYLYPQISNVRAELQGKRWVITYDLSGNARYDVTITATNREEKSITIAAAAGDIGIVNAARGLSLWWEPIFDGMPVPGWEFRLSAVEKIFDWVLVEGGPRGDFYMSATEVTFEQYDKYCNETGASKPSDHEWGRGRKPVIRVDVQDALGFCEWASKKAGKRVTLPEEDEWEYAAKGGKSSRGYTYSGSNNLDEVGWYSGNSGNETHEVATKKPNELGLYDMSGNVWEWTGTGGVLRGGSRYDLDFICTVRYRRGGDPDIHSTGSGFRVRRDL